MEDLSPPVTIARRRFKFSINFDIEIVLYTKKCTRYVFCCLNILHLFGVMFTCVPNIICELIYLIQTTE